MVDHYLLDITKTSSKNCLKLTKRYPSSPDLKQALRVLIRQSKVYENDEDFEGKRFFSQNPKKVFH